MKKIIINADDFGYSKLFNKKILELIEDDSVTSTSIMVDEIDERQKEQVEKLIKLSKSKPISVGLHIYFKNTNFKKEIRRQFKEFFELFNFEPHHIDIHKVDHLKDGYPVIQDFCKERNIPCKNLNSFQEDIMNFDGLLTTKSPSFDGTTASFSEIDTWLKSLKKRNSCNNFSSWLL